MTLNYGSTFRTLRENKNLSISSLADDYISKGMISKFERNESEISISRFFHLLDKIKVTPNEYFFAKQHYHSDDFSQLLALIQQSALTRNPRPLHIALQNEHEQFTKTHNLHSRLNVIMLTATLQELEDSTRLLSNDDLHFLIDYLFQCENWGYYELILYCNTLSALPIESIVIFSRSIPQKILLMKESGKIMEIGFNAILNSLIMCLKHNLQQASQYFLASLADLQLPQTMLFEHTLFKLYNGVYLKKFDIDSAMGDTNIEQALMIFQLANCSDLYQLFYDSVKELCV